MPSPFPGMDPYLEDEWSGVHVLLLSAIASALNRSLPAGLQAKPEEQVRIGTIAGERLHGFRPDVALLEVPAYRSRQHPVESGGVAVAEPVRIEYLSAPVPVRNIEIVDTKNHNRVVTAIEVLSPWNKLPGDLNRAYRKKTKQYERAGASWVEIDLLRSTRSRLAVTWDDFAPADRNQYAIVIYDALDARIDAYPFGVQDAIPVVAIPLREADPVVALDIRSALNRAYDDGGYVSINYSAPCNPPLAKSDSVWFAQRLGQTQTQK